LSPGAAYAVAEPDEEDPEGHGEYRHAQPRHAQQNHQDEHHEGQTQIIAEWVPERLEAWHHALQLHGLAKLEMRQADHRPVDQQRGHHQRHQQFQRILRRQVVDQHAEQRHQGRHGDGQHRYTAAIHLHQHLGCITLFGQAVEHAAVAVHAAVVDRQGGTEHHEVENMRSGVAADEREDLHEGAAAVRIACGAERLQQAVPGIERQQDGQRTYIEDQDAVDHLVDRLGDHGPRVGGLGGGDAHQFQPAEGKHDDGQRHDHPAEAVGEKAAVAPQVADARLLAAFAAQQQVQAEQDHADDGADLDDGEPELSLAEGL